jgi:hypothetical protein
VHSKGLFVLVNRLPEHGGTEITVINFGPAPLQDSVTIPDVTAGSTATDVLDPKAATLRIEADGQLRINLKGYEGRAYRVMPGAP